MQQQKPQERHLWSCQNTFLLLALLGVALGYSMRGNLSVAITAISKLPTSTNVSKKFQNDESSCPYEEPINGTLDPNRDGEFVMSRTERGLTLASSILGLSVSNIVGGIVAEKYGGKLVTGFGIFISSLLTIATPIVLRFSVKLFIFNRFVMGVTEGILLPGVYQMMGSWSLPDERSRVSGTINTGCYIGVSLILATSGVLTKSSFLGGWPSIFYLNGGFGVIWSIFWFSLIHETPKYHPRISEWEREKLAPSFITKSNRPKCIPYKSIFTCKTFIATVMMHCAANFCFYMLFTELPSYFSQVHHLEIRKNGFLSSLPYLVTCITLTLFSRLLSKLSSENRISILNVRKLATSIGKTGYGPASCFIILIFVGCNHNLALAVLVFTVGLTAGQYPGYSGILYGISGAFANVVGFSSTMVVESLVDHYSPVQRWKYVFILTSSLYVVSTTVYLAVVEVERQPWNDEITEDSHSQSEADRSVSYNGDGVK